MVKRYKKFLEKDWKIANKKTYYIIDNLQEFNENL